MRILETERLALRWFDERDAAFILGLVNDPAWITNIGDRGLHTEDEARAWIAEKLVASYWRSGHGLWAIEQREGRALVGMCGLLARETLPAIDVGYAIAAPFRGNGYAREAARGALAYAREVLGEQRVLAIVKPENRASIAVLEAIGMTSDGLRVLPGDTHSTAVFGWDAASRTAPADARASIDALAGRFFAAFSNRDAITRVASIPSMFIANAVVTIVNGAAVRSSDVRSFVTPRAALLFEERLRDFEEKETTSHTEVTGSLAHRSSRYRKSGILDGARFDGGGTKHFQLVRTERGWKIASLAWEDDG